MDDYGYDDGFGRWAQWRRLANHQREYARAHPCVTLRDASSQRFAYRCGLHYLLRLTYETFHPQPAYHISTVVFAEVGSPNEFGQPKEEPIEVTEWTKEHHEAAKDLMMMSLGPVMKNPKQPVWVGSAGGALHWITPDPEMASPSIILIPKSALRS